MEKDNDYYFAIDLSKLAKKVPPDRDAREQSAAFQDLLIALALRSQSEPFTGSQLLAYLGQPDAVKRLGEEEVWEYSWRGEHCEAGYRSSTPFVLKNDRVVGVRHQMLTPSS